MYLTSLSRVLKSFDAFDGDVRACVLSRDRGEAEPKTKLLWADYEVNIRVRNESWL